MNAWQPSGSIETLKQRARIMQKIRAFFLQRKVWEVETPVLSQSGNPDPNIESFMIKASTPDDTGYLHTSPEFAMKRLLSSGSGSIYQLCKVFRAAEVGQFHNPEFTMLEWYRVAFDYHLLMQEVDALLREVLHGHIELGESQFLSYRDTFQNFVKIDPFTAEIEALRSCVERANINVEGMTHASHDSWLSLIMTHIIEPALPINCPVFIYDFPVSQASLARIRDEEPPVAERFELYLNGIELANGFSELTDVKEQRFRFEQENNQREQNAQQKMKLDSNFLEAMEAGLPECAGVALGIDRLIMLAVQASSITEVMAFDSARS